MSHDSATSCVHVPMLDRNAPAHSRRKLRNENAARNPGSARGGGGELIVVSRGGYTPHVPFPCPACDAPVHASPARPALRCPSCGAVLRSRPADDGGRRVPAFDVEATGRPGVRRRVEVPWDDGQRRRLYRWLAVASVVTLALVVVLYALARLAR